MEYTIEQLVDDLVENARWDGICSGMINHSQSKLALENSRSALLSRITQMQQEADEWKEAYAHALKDSDNLYAANTTLKQEADEWKSFIKMVMNHINEDEDDGIDCNGCFLPRTACSICSSEKDKLNIHKTYLALLRKWSKK